MIEKSIRTIMVVCATLACAVFADLTIWDGYQGDTNPFANPDQEVYQISTPAQLAGLQFLVNERSKTFENKTIVLTADIYLNDVSGTTLRNQWAPIGTWEHPFKGTFDGNGHKIYGLLCTKNSNYGNGLFGYASYATIRNLTITKGQVQNGANSLAGAVVAEAPYATVIQNVHSDIPVSVSGTHSVGGLAGRLVGALISSSANADVSGQDTVGGLVGYFAPGYVNLNTGNKNLTDEINGIINSGTYKGNVTGSKWVGGIAGYSKGKIVAGSSKGDVKGSKWVGGLVGYGEGSIICSASASCSFSGTVTGQADYVGGIAGVADSLFNVSAEGGVTGTPGKYTGGLVGEAVYISNSFHVKGDVKGAGLTGGLAGVAKAIINSYHENGLVQGSYSVGGLVGAGADSVVNSHAKADVSAYQDVGGLAGAAKKIVNSYSIGDVTGDYYSVGGLAGSVSGEVTASMSMGNVTGRDSVGGLVGVFKGTAITDAYAVGNVSSNATGYYYYGGIAGAASGAFTRTYARGSVTGSYNYGCVAGGVLPNKTLSSTATYYDKDLCTGGYKVTGSAGTSLSEIETADPFSAWDYTSTWLKVAQSFPVLLVYAGSIPDAEITIEDADNIVYTGSAQMPAIAVSLSGTVLASSNYSVEYKNNIDAGTASVKVCGKTPCFGCKTVNFEIKKDDTAPTVELSNTSYVYNGSARKPGVSVSVGEIPVSTYTVSYANNINAGTATVTVTMTGNYSGQTVAEFEIKKATVVVDENPTASNAIHNDPLSTSILSGGNARLPLVAGEKPFNVPGTFAWKDPTVTLRAYTGEYTAEFVPNDEVNYERLEITVPVKVLYSFVLVYQDGTLLDSSAHELNSTYTFPKAPEIPGKTFQYYLDMPNAYSELYTITASKNIRATAYYQNISYTIRFMNGEEVLKETHSYYGSTPYYGGETPTKPSDGNYTYKFVGWSPALGPTTQDQDYQAVFDKLLFASGAVEVLENEDGRKRAEVNGSYDGMDAVVIEEDIEVDEVKFSREFYTDVYSTITLPFNVNTSALTGIDSVLGFDGIVLDENKKKAVGMWVVWEKDRTHVELKANTPYMVKMKSQTLGISGGATLQPTRSAVTEKNGWEFRGTYNYISWTEEHEDVCRVYGFAAGSNSEVSLGEFVKFIAGAKLRPLRAYLINTKVSCQSAYASRRAFARSGVEASIDESLPEHMNVVVVERKEDGEEHTTVIGRFNTRTGEFKMLRNYDLNGRNVQGKTKARGAYYGKKVVR